MNDPRTRDAELPIISIVTPSYNQAQFLPCAMDSILDQGYPRLEYVVIDGGSDDGSAQIIRAREDRLTYWASEKDGGQYDAINKGFAHTSGEVMGWLNSDDMYMPRALWVIGEIFAQLPEVRWLTTQFPIVWDADGAARECQYERGYSSTALLRGAYGGSVYANAVIQQESTFWRRSLWEQAGGFVDSSMRYAADFDLWVRFATLADIYAVAVPLGGFRRHAAQKTATCVVAYFEEARASLLARGCTPYGHVGGSSRRLFNRLFRGRPVPRVTTSFRRSLLDRGFTHAAKTVAWQDSRWRVRLETLV